MKFAWIEDDRIRDIAWANPFEIFHPDVAKLYDTEVPDDAANGDGWVNGQLVKPTLAPPAPLPPRTWTAENVRAGLTLAERVKWDAEKSDFIKTAKVEFSTALQLREATEVLQMLVDAGDISSASMAKILS